MSKPLRIAAASVLAGAGLPLAVAVAWVPIRTQVPNVDLALILVAVAAAIGVMGRRSAIVVAAVSSALWFEFFDTAPYERLGIARNPDIETTVVLAIVALGAGDLVRRMLQHRRTSEAGSESLSTVRSATELVASGEELVHVIEAVVADLTHLLHLSACTFEAGDPAGERATVSRDGHLQRALGAARALEEVELPVVAQGAPLGRFVLERDWRSPPGPETMLVAVTLADAVGAAFLAQAPPPLPPDRQPSLRLRVLGSAAVAPVGGGAAAAAAAAPATQPSGSALPAGSRAVSA